MRIAEVKEKSLTSWYLNTLSCGICPIFLHDGPRSPAKISQIMSFSIWLAKNFWKESVIFDRNLKLIIAVKRNIFFCANTTILLPLLTYYGTHFRNNDLFSVEIIHYIIRFSPFRPLLVRKLPPLRHIPYHMFFRTPRHSQGIIVLIAVGQGENKNCLCISLAFYLMFVFRKQCNSFPFYGSF